MTPHRFRTPAALALAAFTALAVACGPAGPTPTPTPPPATPSPTPSVADPSASPSGSQAPVDPAAVYAAIEEQVLALRGLEAKRPVDPVLMSDAEIKEYTANSFREDNPAEYIEANEVLLKGFGLLEPDDSLEDLYIELLGSQVAGLYSPDDKELYVVSKSGSIGPVEKTTYAHEYDHALQDQNFDLSSLDLDELGESDRALGRLALVEGDATLLMSLWQVSNLTQAEIIQLLSESVDPEATRVLEEMPPVLRESLFFPYTQGLNFTQRLQSAGGWEAVNEAFENPPASTEQILHPEKYDAGETPIDVQLPDDLAGRMGAAWRVTLEDTLGEFQLETWLKNAGGTGTPDASAAAQGWGGDRVAVLDGGDGHWAIVLRTQWDTAADLEAFREAAQAVVGAGRDPGEVVVDGDAVWVFVAGSDEDLRAAIGAAGLIAGV